MNSLWLRVVLWEVRLTEIKRPTFPNIPHRAQHDEFTVAASCSGGVHLTVIVYMERNNLRSRNTLNNDDKMVDFPKYFTRSATISVVETR